ncbi:hypothetical protein [Nitrosospira multiformis]|nr:hypothetical protein [Nitrosospira multiformis]
MTKEAVFTMKLEPELRRVHSGSRSCYRPASHAVRELMREFIQ